MWKMILRFLKIILIVAVILVITISIILLLLSMQPFVPNNYTQIVKTGGELEAKYLAMGASQVEHMEVSTEEEWGNINVYYPKELTESAKSYPVVVMVNGTGVYSSKYPALFKHLASWGSIRKSMRNTSEFPVTHRAAWACSTLSTNSRTVVCTLVRSAFLPHNWIWQKH